jgi:hypothetical protein
MKQPLASVEELASWVFPNKRHFCWEILVVLALHFAFLLYWVWRPLSGLLSAL